MLGIITTVLSVVYTRFEIHKQIVPFGEVHVGEVGTSCGDLEEV